MDAVCLQVQVEQVRHQGVQDSADVCDPSERMSPGVGNAEALLSLPGPLFIVGVFAVRSATMALTNNRRARAADHLIL
jgi:hypothetical protein